MILPAGLAVYDYYDRRALSNAHQADPRDERWLCQNLDCTKHLRHRGACKETNQ
jgi:hypothetical protein